MFIYLSAWTSGRAQLCLKVFAKTDLEIRAFYKVEANQIFGSIGLKLISPEKYENSFSCELSGMVKTTNHLLNLLLKKKKHLPFSKSCSFMFVNENVLYRKLANC